MTAAAVTAAVGAALVSRQRRLSGLPTAGSGERGEATSTGHSERPRASSRPGLSGEPSPDPEVPEADSMDQSREVTPPTETVEVAVGAEVPEGDAVEQATLVPDEDEQEAQN